MNAGGVTLGSFDLRESVAMRNMRSAQLEKSTALTRLSTGKRINRAADDPSGMVASEGFKATLAKLQKSIEARERENLRLSAQDGGLGVLNDLSLELEGLIVQAANGAGLSDGEKQGIREQIAGVIEGINTVAATTIYNGEQILAGFSAGMLGQTVRSIETTDENGDSVEQQVNYSLASLSSGGAVMGQGQVQTDDGPATVLDIFSADGAELAQEIVQSVNNALSTKRGAIGNQINANLAMIRVEQTEFENVAQANSLIEDADFAKEISNFIRSNTLEQASQQTLLIARDQSAQTALQLLQGVGR